MVGDRDRFEQVAVNLIGNSINHTSYNGRIMIHVQYHLEDKQIVFIVNDNGKGIKKEE